MTSLKRNLGKLAMMLFLPTLFGLALLAWGVRLGEVHRADVLSFEQRYLGMPAPSVDTPPEPVTLPTKVATTDTAPPLPPPPPPPAMAGPVVDASTDAGNVIAPVDAGAPAAPEAPSLVAPGSPAKAIVSVRLKVLVDERFIRQQPQWLSVVQQSVAEASRAYQQRVGIELVLVGIVSWPRALQGLDAAALFADLRTRPREGADILLGMLSVPLDATARAEVAPSPTGLPNGAYAIAGLGETSPPHVRTILWAVGRLLGARPLPETAGSDIALGSWMGDGPEPADGKPWLDLENIQRLHERRGRPFERAPGLEPRPPRSASKDGKPP